MARCRACDALLRTVVIDLGLSPLSNSYVTREHASDGEMFYPLRLFVCDRCFLVQLEAFVSRESIFSDYAYLSSFSDVWLAHAAGFAAAASRRLGLDERTLVAEVASNDGYLLRYFTERSIPVLGIEPAANVAQIAIERGIRSEIAFFGREVARDLRRRYGPAQLIVANNVLAHVPDLHDFVAGFPLLLADDGVISIEFPHVVRLLLENQFDTIYHEHFCYFSLHALEPVFARHGLAVVDVERLTTHGGSLRVWLERALGGAASPAVEELRAEEQAAGVSQLDTYRSFAPKVERLKAEFLTFLIEAERAGKKVAAYGAPAKGNTLLNYCGVRRDMITFTVDRNPLKAGNLLPGSRIPIFEPNRLRVEKPDYVVILPWNIKDEVLEQMRDVREWGGRFVLAIPKLTIL